MWCRAHEGGQTSRGRKRAGGHWAFRMEGERAARVAAEQSEVKQPMFVLVGASSNYFKRLRCDRL